MLIADTNVIVAIVGGSRDPLGDEALRLVRDMEASGECLVVTEGVLVETAWVLAARFGMDAPGVSVALSELLDSSAFVAWDAHLAVTALRIMADDPRLDLVDALLAARDALCDARVVTFDRVLGRAVRRSHRP